MKIASFWMLLVACVIAHDSTHALDNTLTNTSPSADDASAHSPFRGETVGSIAFAAATPALKPEPVVDHVLQALQGAVVVPPLMLSPRSLDAVTGPQSQDFLPALEEDTATTGESSTESPSPTSTSPTPTGSGSHSHSESSGDDDNGNTLRFPDHDRLPASAGRRHSSETVEWIVAVALVLSLVM